MPAPRGARDGQSGSSLLDSLHASVETKAANNLIKLPTYYRSAQLLLRQVRREPGEGQQGHACSDERSPAHQMLPACARPCCRTCTLPSLAHRQTSTARSTTRSSCMSC